MLSSIKFIRQSLETHLFFVRIMKEHSFFLQLGFTPRDYNFIQRADDFRKEFDIILGEVISLSNGVVSKEVLQSGEVITPYTLKAEMASSYFTGVQIATPLTQVQMLLVGGGVKIYNPMFEQRVFMLNQKTIALTSALVEFKTNILSNVLSCKLFTVNYPLLIDHITREAKLYIQIIKKLQKREEIYIEEVIKQEVFWNRIMAEHSKFIRGFLDPTEDELINIANNFGNEFDQLTNAAKEAIDKTLSLEKVTEDSLKATEEIRNFKEEGTKGLLECKIKSIVIPLLGDHVLREASHYLRLLKIFGKVS